MADRCVIARTSCYGGHSMRPRLRFVVLARLKETEKNAYARPGRRAGIVRGARRVPLSAQAASVLRAAGSSAACRGIVPSRGRHQRNCLARPSFIVSYARIIPMRFPHVPLGKPTASPFSQAASSFFRIFAHFLPAFVYTATQGCAIDSPFAAMHVESKTHAGGLSTRFHMQRDLPVSPA